VDPSNVAAKTGIAEITEHYVVEAHNLLMAGQLSDAVIAVDRVRRVSPDDARLPALNAQLRVALERHLAQERADTAVAENPTTSLPSVTAPSPEQNVAADSAAEQKLAREQRRRNSRARLVADIQGAIDNRQFDSAAALLDDAQTMGVAAEERATLAQSLQVAQQSHANSESMQLFLRRTAQDRLIEPEQDSAKHYLLQLARTDPQYPGLQQGVVALGSRLIVKMNAAIEQRDFDLAVRLLSQAREIGYAGTDMSAAETALQAITSPVSKAVASAATSSSEPKVLKLVQPEYPSEARLHGLEGWVDVRLLVTATGAVTNAHVENSSTGYSFSRVALAAVRQWQYEARPSADPTAAQSVKVRVEFRLKD
jgi:TonB family protein